MSRYVVQTTEEPVRVLSETNDVAIACDALNAGARTFGGAEVVANGTPLLRQFGPREDVAR